MAKHDYYGLNQHEQVLKYLDEFGSITPMDAFHDLGITKLATRISELKKKDYMFSKETISKESRFGNPCTFARYKRVYEKQGDLF